jgi:hypothetical protein
MKSVDKVPDRIVELTRGGTLVEGTGTLLERKDFDTPVEVRCSECNGLLLLAKFSETAYLDKLVITCVTCLKNGKFIQAIGGSVPQDGKEG